ILPGSLTASNSRSSTRLPVFTSSIATAAARKRSSRTKCNSAAWPGSHANRAFPSVLRRTVFIDTFCQRTLAIYLIKGGRNLSAARGAVFVPSAVPRGAIEGAGARLGHAADAAVAHAGLHGARVRGGREVVRASGACTVERAIGLVDSHQDAGSDCGHKAV